MTAERFGRLDMLVNNAAVSFGGDLDIPLRRFEVLMRINVRAPLLATRLARPYLAAAPGGGRILNVGSVTATGYFPTMVTYGMSKAALEHLTVTSAAVLAPDGIAVNCYRIDVQVASEGYVMNAPDADHSTWADTATAADGAVWMLSQPAGLDGAGRADAGAGRTRAVHRPPGTGPVHPHRALDATGGFRGGARRSGRGGAAGRAGSDGGKSVLSQPRPGRRR